MANETAYLGSVTNMTGRPNLESHKNIIALLRFQIFIITLKWPFIEINGDFLLVHTATPYISASEI